MNPKLLIVVPGTQNFMLFLPLPQQANWKQYQYSSKREKKLIIQKNEEENHGPPRVRHGMLKLECKQEREGEEQAMGHKSLKRLGHSPPAHHPPLHQHFRKNQKLQELYQHELQRTKNPFLGISREWHSIRTTGRSVRVRVTPLSDFAFTLKKCPSLPLDETVHSVWI